LIGLEIVQLFFFGIEDLLPPFFRFGETVGSLYFLRFVKGGLLKEDVEDSDTVSKVQL
jgi:hypothetical protein